MALTRLAVGALCLVFLSLLPSPATCLVPRVAARVSSRDTVAAATCVNEEILNAMRDDQSAASSFCREFLPALNVTVTQRDTSTAYVGNATVTKTVSSQPTLIFTAFKDVLVHTTSPVACTNGTPVSSLAVPTPTPPLGRGGGRIARDSVLPEYLAAYQASQVSSACSCLIAAGATKTATLIGVVTSSVATVTTQYIAVNPDPIIKSVVIGATRTAVAYSCFSG